MVYGQGHTEEWAFVTYHSGRARLALYYLLQIQISFEPAQKFSLTTHLKRLYRQSFWLNSIVMKAGDGCAGAHSASHSCCSI